MRIVDLSYPVTDDMLVWTGNQRPVFEWKLRGESEHCNVTILNMNVHTGTHADSPKHFLLDGVAIDALPLDRFWGKARVFHFEQPPEGQEISLSAVRDSGFKLGEADICVMHTGVDALAGKKEYNFRFPVPAHDLLDWLMDQGMKTYMTDAPAIDTAEENKPSPRHKRLFARNIPVVENLANLGLIPAGRTFTIAAMPLRLGGREGSPCRAAAWIE